MKPRNFNKKLVLKKRTIANLSTGEMTKLRGGLTRTHPFVCPTYTTTCEDYTLTCANTDICTQNPCTEYCFTGETKPCNTYCDTVCCTIDC
jgi:hypothetical protein